MGEVLKKFGRYFLLDDVAQGGMAEIFRARLASADGAGRLIVIKRIQAGYGSNAEFLQMFKSEIKVTMGFNHPNIVQLYDFGEEQEQPFIAMELVDGKNLRQFISRATELKQQFPIELAAFIMEQAASGLHYAHSFRDKISGEAYNIVHRDISPQNILISYEGNVKVIDFGIAKATTNMEATRAGVIKGKPSYLSPEQISGEVLDGRSDIFALGAVLWECLTGKKLFAGESDLAVLKLIESCQTYVKPPSTLNPKVPKELDYLVLKTLAKQREKRFQNAEELQRAFHKFLYSFAPEFNPSDLAYYAKDLFKNEIVEDRKKIQKLNEKAEALLATVEVQIQSPPKKDDEDTTVVVDSAKRNAAAKGEHLYSDPKNAGKIETDASRKPMGASSPRPYAPSGASHAQGSLRSSAPQQRKGPILAEESSSNGKYVGIGVAALLVLSIFGPDFGLPIPILSDLMAGLLGGSEARLVLKGNQKDVTIAVDGLPVKATTLPTTLTRLTVGTPFRLTINGAAGSFQQDITLRKGEQRTVAVSFSADRTTSAVNSLTTSDKGILLKLRIAPAGGTMSISVNGRDVDPTNPLVRVPLDQALEIRVDRANYKTFRRQVVLESRTIGGLQEWPMDIPLEPTSFGYLTIRSTPSAEATLLLDGTQWKQNTPIENAKMPVGMYTVHLRNEALQMEKDVPVRIEEGKAVSIDERLEIKN